MRFLRLQAIISALPNTISNGQTADAIPLMADLNHIVNQVNANAAPLSNTAVLNATNSFTQPQAGVNAVAGSQFPIASQVQNAAFTTLSSTAGTNTITGRVAALTLTAYASGQVFTFVPTVGNSGAVTENIDGVGAATVWKGLNSGLNNLASDDLTAGRVAFLRYFTPIDAQGTGFQLLNPNPRNDRSAAKAWVTFNGTAGAAILASENIASVVANGTGDYTITFTRPFKNANYTANVTASNGANFRFCTAPYTTAAAVGSFRVATVDSTITLADSSRISAAFFGD